ncbi:hypothetical protein I5M32_06380 [Pedobacter sp. SD-b]|uniref:Lipoprotein n=1 Tax=Pedobacter segetis TaxID=2793069 RepID=A0ABS1BI94_9SPHI|nr:hypothetical protein [Pedobacter segetis]MBK0382585.1 hypothetical protein [Pedobacter segetis]
MKNIITLIFCVFTITPFFACTNNQKQKANEKLAALNPSKNIEANGCLLQYATKYEELLSVDKAAAITGLATADAKTDYNKLMDDPTFQSLTYKWKGDRKKKIEINRMVVNVPSPNYIKISGMKPFTIELFRRDYTKKTEKEIAQISIKLDKAFDKALDQKSESKEANKAAKNIERTGTSKAKAKTVVENMKQSGLMKILGAYEPVNGLGDAASWNTLEKRLYVLKDGVCFYIETDLSDKPDINKEKAIEAARAVLAKCN